MPNDATGPLSPPLSHRVEEVRGTFPSDDALQRVLLDLRNANFDRQNMSLPDLTLDPSRRTPEQGADDPNDEQDERQTRTLATGMAAAAAGMAAAGIAVATGGAALPVVGAAVAGMIGGAAVAEGASLLSDASGHESREQAAREGRLVLSLRELDEGRQRLAMEIMTGAGATRVEPVVLDDDSVSAAGWTG